MTDKQKEAIKFVQNEIKRKQKIINESKCNNRFTTFYQDLQNKINNDEILVNLIQTQQAEIEKYKTLYAESTAERVVTSLKDREKSKEDLEMLYKGCQIELEKKDKIIDEMAKCIDTELSSSRLGIILNKNVKPLESYKEYIKQYFERKVEE